MKEYKLDTTTLMGAWYISKKLCDKIKKAMDTNNLTPGIMYRHGQQTVVKEAKESFELSVGVDNDSEPFNEYRQTIQDLIRLYCKKYEEMDNTAYFGIGEKYNLQKYPIGGGFKVWHCENDFKSFNYDRCLVFMTYLNDVEDGGTSFKYQNINMPAKKGLTVLWPAYWTHTHKGVISFTKEKYIATGWLNYIEHRQMQIEQGKIQ
jgi:hypothetical protein|tara:strand:+ start:534 stop:1148 length:615 start_codon:yes stop_codon:yes gene_type:complete